MPFPSSSSNFYLELGLSKGCCLVGAFGLVYHFCCLPKWLAPALGFAFCILSEPYSVGTLFIKSTADLSVRKVSVDWRSDPGKTLPFLWIKGNQPSAACLRSCELAPCSVPLNFLGSLLTRWQFLPRTLNLFRKMTSLDVASSLNHWL